MSVEQLMRVAISKVATGPEYSKDQSLDEAYQVMRAILAGEADPVQAGVWLIALRMKRETLDEYAGVLKAVIEVTDTQVANVPELMDVCDPYDGFARGLAVSPFLPAAIAATGLPCVSHGMERIGPKWGVTHHQVLRAAGVDTLQTPAAAKAKLEDPAIGWAYVDQAQFCPPLFQLMDLRRRIIKRPLITTIETMVGPIRASERTHRISGFVHKAYPPIYAHIARESGFYSAAIVRGVEGGMTPSLKQSAKFFSMVDGGEEREILLEPSDLGIEQTTRATPLPAELTAVEAGGDEAEFDVAAAAKAAAEHGLAALSGASGAARDTLVYAGAIGLFNAGKSASLIEAADCIRGVLDDGSALARFNQAKV